MKILTVLLSAIFSVGLAAADDPKSLPNEFYTQMKAGKKLEKVWISPEYTKGKGFQVVTPVEYKAEFRSGELMDYLPKALGTLGKADSELKLHSTVVKVGTKTYTGFGYAMGVVILEGKIVDATGKIVACFIAKERAGSFGSPKDDYVAAADKIASDIAADLL